MQVRCLEGVIERNGMPKDDPQLVLLAQLVTLALSAQNLIKVLYSLRHNNTPQRISYLGVAQYWTGGERDECQLAPEKPSCCVMFEVWHHGGSGVAIGRVAISPTFQLGKT